MKEKYLGAGLAVVMGLVLVACGGGGGGGGSSSSGGSTGGSSSSSSSTGSAPLAPIAVQRTSYLNAKNIDVGSSDIPRQNIYLAAYAYADFFQDGSESLITIEQRHCIPGLCQAGMTPAPTYADAVPSQIYFYHRENGVWVDRTSKLLADSSTCVEARKAAVADLNGDGKPDVVLACTGYDASPFPGENPRVLLSQPDGAYKSTTLTNIQGFVHSVAAIDTTGSGYADLVFSGIGPFGNGNIQRPVYYTNNHDGTFSATTKLDSSVLDSVYTIEPIDLNGDGKYDLVFSGTESSSNVDPTVAQSMQSVIYYNDGSYNFGPSSKHLLPQTGSTYGTILDMVYTTTGKLVVERTVDNSQNSLGFYGGVQVQSIDLTTDQYSILYTHNGTYGSTTLPNWWPWIKEYRGSVVPLESAFGVNISL
jgi:hypothetical protein